MQYLSSKVSPSAFEQIVTTLYVRRRRVLIVFVAIIALDLVITALVPRKYDSRMKVLVRNDRPDLVVTAGANQGSLIATDVTEDQVNSEIELLKSNDILAGVVRACNLDGADVSGALSGTTEEKAEKAIRKLDRELYVTPVRHSEVILVNYSARSPELARKVLQSLSELYLDAHVRVHSSAGTEPFFQRQSDRYEKDMHEAESSLDRFNRQNDIVAMDSQKEVMLQKASDFEGDMREAEASRAETVSQDSILRQEITSLDKRVVTQSRVVPNQYSVERLNTMMAELNNRRTLALLKFRPEDRAIKEIDEEIANTRVAMERSAKLSSVEESTDRNPVRNELENQLARGQAQEDGLKAKVTILAAALAGVHERLTALDSVTREHENLVRSYSQAEQNYLLYAKKKEEGRIAEALDRQKIGNVVIEETPMEHHLPSSPDIPVNLALGVLFACAASIGTTIAGHMNSPFVTSPGELEAGTGVMVLAVIPPELSQITDGKRPH